MYINIWSTHDGDLYTLDEKIAYTIDDAIKNYNEWANLCTYAYTLETSLEKDLIKKVDLEDIIRTREYEEEQEMIADMKEQNSMRAYHGWQQAGGSNF